MPRTHATYLMHACMRRLSSPPISTAVHGDGAYTIVDRTGSYRTFRAINVAALVDARDRGAFRSAVRAASAVVVDAKLTLADFVAFQPVESFHLTAVQLYNSNATAGNWSQYVSDHLGFFQKLSGILQGSTFQPKVVFDANGTLSSAAISGRVGSPVQLLVRDATDLQKWVDKIPYTATLDMRDREEILNGIHRAVPFHITLGRATRATLSPRHHCATHRPLLA